MKQLILFLGTMMLLSGCKKEDSKQKELLLSAISSDGAVTTRMHYDDNNRITRYESYSSGSLAAYILFEYDGNGHITKMGSFSMPGDVPMARYQMQPDAQGRVTTVTAYEFQNPTPNTPVSIATYTYNVQGRISKIVSKDNSGELLNSLSLLYFPDGNLKETQTYKEENNLLWLWQKTVYSVTDGSYPKGIDKIAIVLGPQIAANIFSESIHGYLYDKNGTILTHTSRLMSGREFNTDGSLQKQVETYTSIKPVQPKVIYNRGYEYILK